MKHLFIVNPTAGKGKALSYIPKIHKLFENQTTHYLIEITEYPGHAAEIAKQYSDKGSYRIYSVGGDGTLNEVLNGMAGTSSALGVIPGGSGCDFIKSICRSWNTDDILKRTVEGEEVIIDAAKVNGRYFINISSIGFDAEVANTAGWLKQLPLISGSIAYAAAAVATIFKKPSHTIEITIDGVHSRIYSLLAAVANGKYYGGGMMPVPHAVINDGLLDICVIKRISRLKIIAFLYKFMKGQHGRLKEVTFYAGKKIEIRSANPIALNIDGEVERVREAVFEMVPEGASLILPKPCPKCSTTGVPALHPRS